MLIFLAFFPMMMICKVETTWPQEVKTIGGREASPEKDNFLHHRISACTTDIYRDLYNLVKENKAEYNLVKEKKAEGLIFYFWVFNGTICMRELQDSCVILHMNLISDTLSVIFLTKLVCSVHFAFFCCRFMFCEIFFHKLLHSLLFPR